MDRDKREPAEPLSLGTVGKGSSPSHPLLKHPFTEASVSYSSSKQHQGVNDTSAPGLRRPEECMGSFQRCLPQERSSSLIQDRPTGRLRGSRQGLQGKGSEGTVWAFPPWQCSHDHVRLLSGSRLWASVLKHTYKMCFKQSQCKFYSSKSRRSDLIFKRSLLPLN